MPGCLAFDDARSFPYNDEMNTWRECDGCDPGRDAEICTTCYPNAGQQAASCKTCDESHSLTEV